MKRLKGHKDLVCIPYEIFQIVEDTRLKLGMNRAAFYRYCILKMLDEMSLLKSKIKETNSEQSLMGNKTP